MDRKCHWQGCTAGARWKVKVHLECQGTDERRLLGFDSTIECCDEHRENVRPWVLSDQNREVMTTVLMESGYAEPNFLTMRVEFLPISEATKPFTVLEPCNREGCTRSAKWRIVQVIPHITGAGEPARLLTNLCVCDQHKGEIEPSDLLDPESKAATVRALHKQGVTMRSMNKMRLEFMPLVQELKQEAG